MDAERQPGSGNTEQPLNPAFDDIGHVGCLLKRGDQAGKLLGVDRTYCGHHETDAFEKRTWLGHASLFPNTTCVASLSLRQLASHVACLIQEQLRHRAYHPAFERYDPDRKRRSLQFDRHFP
jgi:hypothetical protein